jgi:hypothetical protein
MAEKRYAIVRVDDKSDNNCKNCEMLYTNDNGNNDCRLRIGASFLCDRYGDTKKQLIKKIVQVLRQPNGLIKGMDKQHSHRAEYLAEEIVEFLGVE